MGLDALLVAAIAVLSLALLVSGKLSLDLIGLGLILVLVFSGQVEARSALAGFGNGTVVTLAGLYVIGEGLTRTSAMAFLARLVLRLSGGSPTRLLLVLCCATALISAVASNTAVMLVFLPLAIGLSRDLGIPVSRLLMPMAFASIFGGTLTLVGSSINLLTSGAAEAYGAAPLGMFEMTPIAAPLCLVGVPLTVYLARKLLPDRSSLSVALAAAPTPEFVTELTVGGSSPLIGRPVSQSLGLEKVEPLFLVRDERMIWPPFRKEVVEPGDVLMLRGPVQRLLDLGSRLELQMHGDTRFDPHTMVLFELAVAPRSTLAGRQVRDLHLWRDFGVIVVAVLRGGHHFRERASQMILRPGDVLLVSGPEESQARLRSSMDFFLLQGIAEKPVLKAHGRRALWVLAAVVALFSLGGLGLSEWLPIPMVSLAGATAMVLAGCLRARRAYRAIDWPILIFVVGALALGEAMKTSALADSLAHGIVKLMSGLGPAAVASGLLFVGTFLNQLTSPYAVTVLLTPIALATAGSLGLEDPRPFLLAIAFSGSNAFATPMGHQVNLMVLGPGGYRFSDFLRLGLPLCLFFWVFVSVGLALATPG
ncbi:MAG: SLC13 family permease [Planctomycetes bacterium]|nr:SLC13 family permease [Planctomycetota bacterium]MBL7007552.1 SLC13 family permease [Planctomycetota bacterium]